MPIRKPGSGKVIGKPGSGKVIMTPEARQRLNKRKRAIANKTALRRKLAGPGRSMRSY